MSLLSLSNLSAEARLLLPAPTLALRREDKSPLVSALYLLRGLLFTSTIGGIAFQLAAVVVYILLTIEFLIRFALKKPFSRREDTLNGARPSVVDSKTKQMIIGVGLSSLAMFIR